MTRSYYYLGGASIMKHDMRTNKTSVLIDYSKQPEFQFHEILRGGTGDTSKDNWISFWAPDEKQLCAIDLTHVKTYCADYSASQRKLVYGDIDFTLISKGVDRQTGKRYVHDDRAARDGRLFRRHGARHSQARIPRARGRGTGQQSQRRLRARRALLGRLSRGHPGRFRRHAIPGDERRDLSPCEVSLSTYQLNKGIEMNKQIELGGGRKRVMTLWRCGPGWVDEHVGCARSAPYCVISTQNVPPSGQ